MFKLFGFYNFITIILNFDFGNTILKDVEGSRFDHLWPTKIATSYSLKQDLNNDSEVSIKLSEHCCKTDHTFSSICFKRLNGYARNKKVTLPSCECTYLPCDVILI